MCGLARAGPRQASNPPASSIRQTTIPTIADATSIHHSMRFVRTWRSARNNPALLLFRVWVNELLRAPRSRRAARSRRYSSRPAYAWRSGGQRQPPRSKSGARLSIEFRLVAQAAERERRDYRLELFRGDYHWPCHFDPRFAFPAPLPRQPDNGAPSRDGGVVVARVSGCAGGENPRLSGALAGLIAECSG